MDAYNRVITGYPEGDRVPDAYYKRADASSGSAAADRAREAWDTLIKMFPDAEVARLGKQKLDRLSRGRPQP